MPNGPSDFEDVTNPMGRKMPSLADMRRITGASTPSLPQVPEKRVETPFTSAQPGLVRKPSVYAKQLQSSGFDDDERTNTDVLMGNVATPKLDDDEEEVTVTTPILDGENAPPELTSVDTWKAIAAPITSRVGRRSAELYNKVITQFAAGHNPRYEPDDSGKTRMHIFVWDVTRAMGCEVPHFLAGRELSIGQTVDWMRFEGHTRGWKKASSESAAEAADRGEAVVAVPKDPKAKLMAIARPGGLDAQGFPRVATAIPEYGNDLSVIEALASSAVEYFVHE